MSGDLRKPRHKGSILMAGMVGLANALGWDQYDEVPEIHADASGEPPDFDLDFGSLDPLS